MEAVHTLHAFTRIATEGSGSNLLEGLGINLVQILAQIVNFLLIMYFLNGMVIRPILRNLEARRKRIEDSLENARKADERLANADKEYQIKLHEAATEANKFHTNSLIGVQAELQQLRADASAEAEKIKAQARVDAVAECNQILADTRNQIVSLVMAATNKLVGDSLDANRQKVLINDFFNTIPAASVSGVMVDGAPVTVTSAVPLTTEEQSKVKADLSLHLGDGANINFDVNPGILGGLIVHVGDRTIDGSVLSKVNAMRQQLSA